MTTVDIRVDIKKAQTKIRRIRAALDTRKMLNAIGLRQLKWINDNFKQQGRLRESGGWKPLADSTRFARRQGSPQVLQDTGRLRQSFVHKVSGTKVSVGTADKKAAWHEFGTSPYIISPKNKNSLVFAHPNGTATIKGHGTLHFNGKTGFFLKEVHHPGLEPRPMLPTRRQARKLAKDVLKAFVKREFQRAGR